MVGEQAGELDLGVSWDAGEQACGRGQDEKEEA
jgi:hypothetical protein